MSTHTYTHTQLANLGVIKNVTSLSGWPLTTLGAIRVVSEFSSGLWHGVDVSA